MINSPIDRVNHRVTALQAQALVNDFLSDSLPVGEASLSENRFTASLAEWVDDKWQVPVILAYPQIGSLGSVGEVQVDAETVQILSHTPLEQMKRTGMALYIYIYTANQNAIERKVLISN
jgi:hypothetical protein